jgi:hypothetical protein
MVIVSWHPPRGVFEAVARCPSQRVAREEAVSRRRSGGEVRAFATESGALDTDTVVTGHIEGTCSEGWRVIVLIARPSGHQPIMAGEIDARLVDQHGHGIPVLRRPEGSWVEAGGAAGTTASAEFLFAPSPDEPKLLEVRSRRRVAKLEIALSGR